MVVPVQVTVHPLVLLSVVDHYDRVGKDSKKRVVGVLLGSASKGEVDITNSFAVPFEEDSLDSSIWFMDHSYIETMADMLRKVNAREGIVGWYSTGPKLKVADVDVNDVISTYCEHPVLVICEVQPREVGLPVHAYVSRQEVRPEGTEKAQHMFVHLPTRVSQTEAEEIGVEHLLRDVKDSTISTLSSEVKNKAEALKGLTSRLCEMQEYVQAVLDNRLPVNNEIVALMQTIFNLLPNLNLSSLSQALTVQANDMTMAVYVASMIRTVVSLHSLIENKEARVWEERKRLEADKKQDESETLGAGTDAGKGADAAGDTRESKGA